MQIEIELKLAIKSTQIAALEHWLTQQQAQFIEHCELHTIYYDSADYWLQQHGFALRIRQQNGQWRQTIKACRNPQQVLQERYEWDTPLTHPQPDFSQFPEPTLKQQLQNTHFAARIQAQFSTEFTRRNWQLVWQQSTLIVSLDLGWVKAGTARTRLSEVELELSHGPHHQVNACAKQLQQTLALTPLTMSKAERGYRLLTRMKKPT